jgi:hypothetical protein
MGKTGLELLQAQKTEAILELVDDELGRPREALVLLRRRLAGIGASAET